MRRLGLSPDDIAEVAAAPHVRDFDPMGRPRFTGTVRGMRVRLVLALDEPDLVVSVHERRKR
jgi:hypothetical protein